MVVYLPKTFHTILIELIGKYRLGIEYSGGVVLTLPPNSREGLLNAAMTERKATGTGPDGEPNVRGLLLEGLVDQLTRHEED